MKLKKLGRLLKGERTRHEMSLREVAKEVPGAMTYERVRRVESGNGTLEDAARLIKFYEVRMDSWMQALISDVIEFSGAIK